MRRVLTLGAWLGGAVLAAVPVQGQQHYATRLGNPATRFATPLQTPEDLRRMLTSEALRADVTFIARESGYQGDMEDLRQAALKANILELKIPTKTLLPAMSTREHGRAVLLREVLWNGPEPIPAYEFYFASKGRRYRVVTPKPCANFWVEDYGVELRPVLTVQCHAPEEALLTRAATICLAVTNTGNAPEAMTTVTLATPEGSGLVGTSGGGRAEAGRVVWEIPNLPAGAGTNLCAAFKPPQTGALPFTSTVRGRVAPPVESRCATRIMGLPSVLLEVVDLADPVEVGKEQTYQIKVTNQGSAVLTKVKVVCTLEETQEFVSGSGASVVSAEGRIITLATLPTLGLKEQAVWQVVVKALQAGDVRFATELKADQFERSINETESTRQY